MAIYMDGKHDNGSEHESENQSQVRIDRDDVCMKVLNIPNNQIPEDMKMWLLSFVATEYTDNSGCGEDIYHPESIRAKWTEKLNDKTSWNNSLSQIEDLMVEHDCTYLRIIKV